MTTNRDPERVQADILADKHYAAIVAEPLTEYREHLIAGQRPADVTRESSVDRLLAYAGTEDQNDCAVTVLCNASDYLHFKQGDTPSSMCIEGIIATFPDEAIINGATLPTAATIR